ncbi:MAG: 50S ribosomal protein L35 [Planctomycetota bacterium]
MTKVKKVKAKTHKGAKKRMKVTKSGKVKRYQAGTGHLLSSKNGKRRRRLRKSDLVDNSVLKKYRLHLGA